MIRKKTLQFCCSFTQEERKKCFQWFNWFTGQLESIVTGKSAKIFEKLVSNYFKYEVIDYFIVLSSYETALIDVLVKLEKCALSETFLFDILLKVLLEYLRRLF